MNNQEFHKKSQKLLFASATWNIKYARAARRRCDKNGINGIKGGDFNEGEEIARARARADVSSPAAAAAAACGMAILYIYMHHLISNYILSSLLASPRVFIHTREDFSLSLSLSTSIKGSISMFFLLFFSI